MDPIPASNVSSHANKTAPTPIEPVDFLAGADISGTRRKDAQVLMELMGEVTGAPARMWGPSIIGYGTHHYKYASGREGDSPAVAFSPRKASLVLYGLGDAPQAAPLLAALGKYKAGASCIYINKLADVDMAVLRRLVILCHQHTAGTDPQPPQAP